MGWSFAVAMDKPKGPFYRLLSARLFEFLTFFVNLVKIFPMRKYCLIYKLAFLSLSVIAFSSCKKENGIDNNTVVKKPYGLYIGDAEGSLFNTNDGDNYKTVFDPDGFPSRALITSGNNIVWVKGNVHLSEDNGKNFNPTYDRVNAFYFGTSTYLPWQSIILDAPEHHLIYICSIDSKGVAVSRDHGKTWGLDNKWDNGIANGVITSLTQIKSGVVFGHNLDNDSLYRKEDSSDNWSYVKTVNGLPGSGIFYLSHFNNSLVATDVAGINGVYHSDDEGKNWVAYSGLPNALLYTTASPFDQVLLVGTDSMGIYRLQGGSFIPSNNGLETNTVVYAIVGKEDIYKNEVVKRYVYIATNKGLYRSEDLGQNWALVKPGSYVAVY